MSKRTLEIILNRKLAILSLIFGAGFWIMDIFIDVYFFNEGTVGRQLLHPEPMEVYFRLLVGLLFVSLGMVSQLLLNRQKLLAAEAKLKGRLLDEVNDAVVAHEPDGNFIYFNKAATKSKGGGSGEGKFNMLGLLIAPANRERLKGKFGELEKKGESTFEISGMREDNANLVAEIHAKLMELNGKKIILSVARDITSRKEQEETRNRLLKELQEALSRIKTLKGLIPICANCKKIRNDQGFWLQVEDYVKQHTEADFSYGLCEDCVQKLYPGIPLGEEGGDKK
jgi:PAS domain S-box-containing protein